MLDIHTHILPGMDDGSRSVHQSMTMLQREASQNVHMVALTPHYNAARESPAEFIERRQRAKTELDAEVYGRANVPKLLMGAEVAFFDGMSRCEDIDLLCITNTNAMLIEMPYGKWNQRMLNELQELYHFRRIRPILAHVERYMSLQKRGLVEEMVEQGMLIQVNTSFFLQWQTSWKAMRMLKNRHIHFLASDCHDLQRRPPNIGEALHKIDDRLGRDAIRRLKINAKRLLGE